ncbi:hypothetical protein C4M97_00950 [Mycoplasmopsis pullorum]|uniref:MAG3240 family lipoprotein n=1 Tax=Mycoplasmopsis pullorum TaxID=48003 RepID=UPI00111B6CDE|nr:hypothetical protein [Mycoplasmopsis pullorum]TNK82494.1 hypothetical protein C4M94_00695 [Mycoplasmopsis pullorum]TNK83267.1 hypothetical protein C4M80_00855 [Mycoplasmopsis pullorum]TNK84970.1 hypothetical protein C4M81_00690 [Mycoplasmopsis pullorum]TNK85561.1 hypothetical protein C4M92_00925 [Mycoplasmopsis pullorum]TNK86060.1 hypothetical protein C4M85_01475 [Mycoplasmopsis pullorum]
MSISKKIKFLSSFGVLLTCTNLSSACHLVSNNTNSYEFQADTKNYTSEQFFYLLDRQVVNNLIKINNKFIYQIQYENNQKIESNKFDLNKNKLINLFFRPTNHFDFKEAKRVNIDDVIAIPTEIDFEKDNSYTIRTKFENLYPNETIKPNIHYLYSMLNDQSSYWKNIFPEFIPPKKLRIESFKNNNKQIEIYEHIINFYLRAFRFGKEYRVSINEIEKINDNLLALKLKNYSDNQDLTTLYLGNFFEYSTINPSYSFKNTSENITFNEYISDPELLINASALNFTSFDSLLENGNNFNAKGFNYLISNEKEMFYVEVPDYKKTEDIAYWIEIPKADDGDSQFAEFVPEGNVAKIYVHVQKMPHGDFVKYPWYSVDFNSHHHLMSNYKTIQNGEIVNWDYKKNNFTDYKTVSREFIQGIIDQLQDKLKNNLSIWDGRRQNQIEAYEMYEGSKKSGLSWSLYWFSFLLNDEILKYMIARDEDFNSSIKYVELRVKSFENPGKLIINLWFYDYNNKEIKFEFGNTFELKGFKGSV